MTTAEWSESPDPAPMLNVGVDPLRAVAGKDAVRVGETIDRKVSLLARHYGGRER